MIEVVKHDHATDVCIAASGWGGKADWFRNIQHKPQVTLTVGRRTWPATAVVLSEREAEKALLTYARNHPIAFRELAAIISGHRVGGPESTSHEMAHEIPLVAFHPDEPTARG